MNINTLFQLVLTAINKNQGVWAIPRFNSAVESASLEYFLDCIGQSQQSKNGQQVNDMVFQSNERISNNLRLLIPPPLILQVNAQGQATRPTDFVYTSSIRFFQGQRQVEVKFVRDNNLAERLDSELLQPDKNYPIYCIYDGFFQFYPKDLIRVSLTYLRKPVTPVWNFTLVNNRPVYDPITSVDPEFPDECLNELAMRVCSLMGLNIREQQIIQYAEQQKSQGV